MTILMRCDITPCSAMVTLRQMIVSRNPVWVGVWCPPRMAQLEIAQARGLLDGGHGVPPSDRGGALTVACRSRAGSWPCADPVRRAPATPEGYEEAPVRHWVAPRS